MAYRLLLTALLFLIIPASAPLTAAGPETFTSAETRTYEILVDHAVVGHSSLTIRRYSDGTEVATTEAKLTVTWTIFKYEYEFQGKERWSQGQLQELSSRAVDGGKQLTLAAVQTAGGWRITKSIGPPTMVRAVQLTTNYWRQPALFGGDEKFSILDADNGKTYEVRCTPIGQEELKVGATSVLCNHYRLTNDLKADLWFDAAGYLVRRVGTEDGHATELRMKAVPQQTVVLSKSAG